MSLREAAERLLERWESQQDMKRACKEAWRYADKLEQERTRLNAELARAMRVVEAARRYRTLRDVHSGSNIVHCFEEWEAGR